MSVPGDLQLAVGAFCVAAGAYNYAEISASQLKNTNNTDWHSTVKNKAKTVSIR